VADQRIRAKVTPLAGTSHLLGLRCGGAQRGYYAGFDGPGRVTIFSNDFGFRPLASTDFDWVSGRDYMFAFEAIGDRVALSIDGTPVLSAADGRHERGMVACGAISAARARYASFEVEEL
jgi:hypothetical protein